MNKKQILASLNNIADNLDENGLYEEANILTNIMQKVAQMPAPTAPVQPTGFLQNIGNAFSNVGNSIGQELPALGQAAMDVLKYPAKLGAEPVINAFNTYRRDTDYRKKQQYRYYVDTELKKITDTAINNIKNNQNLTFPQAKLQTVNISKNHPNFQQINNFCINTYKMSFPDIVATYFDTYVVSAFPTQTGKMLPQQNARMQLLTNEWNKYQDRFYALAADVRYKLKSGTMLPEKNNIPTDSIVLKQILDYMINLDNELFALRKIENPNEKPGQARLVWEDFRKQINEINLTHQKLKSSGQAVKK